MKPIQVATLLIRYGCIWAFVDALVTLVELPADIYGILSVQSFGAQSDYLVTQREIALGMLFVRFCIYAGTGVILLAFARPIARLLIRGFGDDPSA